MSAEFFMVEIVNSKMLSKITLYKLLVVVRVFLLLSAFGFDADWAKSTIFDPLSDNSVDEPWKHLETGSCTLSEWLMFFETVVLDKVKLVDLDTLFTSLIVSICIWSFIYIDITGRNII